MVNYSHMLVGALALTSFVLLVKYRNLTSKMSEDHVVHVMSKKALESDLETEIQRKKSTEERLTKTNQELKEASSQLKASQTELFNTANALQTSLQQIEALKRENASKTEVVAQLKKQNSDLQQKINTLQGSLDDAENMIAKTKALSDDNANTVKFFQEKQAQLLDANQNLAEKLENFKAIQAENENLKNQLKAALERAQSAKAKATEPESSKSQKGPEKVQAPGNATRKDAQPQSVTKAGDKVQKQGSATVQKSTGPPVTAKKNLGAKETPKELPQPDTAQNANASEELKPYDMLEDDVKEQVKKEMLANDNEAAADEGGDGPQEEEEAEAPAEDVEQKDEAKQEDKGKVEGEANGSAFGNAVTELSGGDGPGDEGEPIEAKKSFVEEAKQGWSFGGKGNEISFDAGLESKA